MAVHIVVGMFYGDESKGAAVDFLCHYYNSRLVVRYNGGHQCGHRVVLKDGREHIFSQFGSGTLQRIPTYYSQYCIFEPLSFEVEKKHLQSLIGNSIYELFYLNQNCLVTSYYHILVNRMLETKREENRHGSCGSGIGQTRKYWLEYGQDSIFAKDLTDFYTLEHKLRLIQQRLLLEHKDKKENGYWHEIKKISPSKIAKNIYDCSKQLKIVNNIQIQDNTVFEGAQGIMLDEYYGEFPHVTWSTTTPQHAHDLLSLYKFKKEIVGCIRTYVTRHGNGPLKYEVFDKISEDPNNQNNDWQGKMRNGVLDIELLRKNVNLFNIDYLFVSHLDKTEYERIKTSTKTIEKICPIKYKAYGETREDRTIV